MGNSQGKPVELNGEGEFPPSILRSRCNMAIRSEERDQTTLVVASGPEQYHDQYHDQHHACCCGYCSCYRYCCCCLTHSRSMSRDYLPIIYQKSEVTT